jgi:multiple sugar transport system substrate-binding protein
MLKFGNQLARCMLRGEAQEVPSATHAARFLDRTEDARAGPGRFQSVMWLVPTALFLLSGLIACSSIPVAATSTPAGSTNAAQTHAPTSASTPVSTNRVIPGPTTTPGGEQAITLIVWAPEQFSPEAGQGGDVLQRQVNAFSAAHPGVTIKFQLKNPYGTGGLLDFLVQVQSLIPERLPDMIIIDSREADIAVRTGLVQPLDHDLPSGDLADLLTPAQTLAKYSGQWLTLPLTLDVQHLAYNSKLVPVPPKTWDDLIKAGAAFAFPADDDDAFLFQYLENQGRIAGAQEPAPLNVSVTTSVLTFYQRARTANLVPDGVLSVKTAHDVWPLFAEGQAPLAEVEASDYIAGSGNVPNAGFAALPTQDGLASTLVSSWNYAIITADPRRHAAAAAFLNWIDEPSRLAEWATSSGMVPARRSAFAISIKPNEYGDFLLGLLDKAIVAPTFAERAPYGASWHTALQEVLRGQATPAEAALTAAQELAP